MLLLIFLLQAETPPAKLIANAEAWCHEKCINFSVSLQTWPRLSTSQSLLCWARCPGPATRSPTSFMSSTGQRSAKFTFLAIPQNDFMSFIWTPSLWLVFIFFGFLANRLQPKRCWCCLLARVRLTRNLFWMINHLELYMVASVLPRDCWFNVLRSCLCSKKTRVKSNLIPNVSSLLGFKVTWKKLR